MALKTFIGDAGGIARKIKKLYAGDASGIARELKSLYIGDASGIARKIYEKIKKFLVSLSVSPSGSGSVSGGGTYEEGTSVTVKAVPASGYKFSAWKEGGSSVSANASYTFSISANRSLTALFAALPKGVVWKLSSMPVSANWTKVVFGNGVFVALSSKYTVIDAAGTSKVGLCEQTIAYSTDGANWRIGSIKFTASTTNYARYLYTNIIFSGDRFIAVDKSPSAAYSLDGKTWKYNITLTIVQGTSSMYLAYGDGVTLAVGTTTESAAASGYAYTPNGGVSWGYRIISTYTSNLFTFCAYGFGKFFLTIRNSTKAMYSTDPTSAKSWTEISLPVSSGWIRYLYAGGKLIFLSSTTLIYSTNGTTFTKATLPLASGMSGIAYGNGKFIITFSTSANRLKYMYSSDGVNWTLADNEMPANNSWYGLTYGNNRFVAVAGTTINCGYAVDS